MQKAGLASSSTMIALIAFGWYLETDGFCILDTYNNLKYFSVDIRDMQSRLTWKEENELYITLIDCFEYTRLGEEIKSK